MSDDRNGPRSTTSAQQQKAERASAKRQEAEHRLASSRKAEKKLARREASEHRKAQRTSAKRRQTQQEAAEHRRSERELAARRQAAHAAVEQQRVEQEAAARRQAHHEEAQREAAARREAQQEAAEHRRAEREAAERSAAALQEAQRQEAQLQEAQRQEAARGKTRHARPERRAAPQRRSTDQAAPHESSAKRKGPGLLLLVAGLAAGALVAAVISARKTAGEAPRVSERELVLRDEEAWTYETKLVVYAPAGAIAGHVHDVGGFPGLVGPLDGPPMDRVDWTEPEGARLRFQVHARSGGGPSDTTVQIARGSRTGPLNGLESEVRDALAALRTHLERA